MCYLQGGCYFLLLVSLCSGTPIALDSGHSNGHRYKRQVTNNNIPPDRTKCQPGDVQPPIRVNTTERVAAMREAMRNLNIYAFIVLTDDAHGSEYPAKSDERRDFISGFTGSAGSVVVTLEKAALWTDGRYFLEADDALDCNWYFMRTGEPGVPTLTNWVISEMKNVSNPVVGGDPFLISNSAWQSYKSAFSASNIEFKEIYENPVDTAWKDKPSPPQEDINVLELYFSGYTWQNKIADLRKEMIDKGAGAFVVTSLDETAWLFNLRGKDIAYNPFFLSYALVEIGKIRLYIYNVTHRLTMQPTDSESNTTLQVHLNTSLSGECTGDLCVQVLEYNGSQVVHDVQELSGHVKIWVTYTCNYAIFNAINSSNRIQDRSYVALAKSMKNSVEVVGMQRSHDRDSTVLIQFLAFLEKEVKEGKHWTEVSAAEKLKSMREAAKWNRGLSFGSISASGPNGAIIHYSPSNLTDLEINTTTMYLLDSGGQYLDGTTDVTRTMHFGNPSEYQIECYTRVLMGAIDLALMIWPEGLYGREIDMSARAPLWSVGLEYKHGTGHGIGAYLSVHEGPGRISLTHASNPSEEYLQEHMFFSDEPGYYEADKFGIRLETIVMVEAANVTYKPPGTSAKFLKFRPITLVPFEPNLIDLELLSHRQIKWLNYYNQLIQDNIEPGLQGQALAWSKARTKPIPEKPEYTSAASQITIAYTVLILISVLMLI